MNLHIFNIVLAVIGAVGIPGAIVLAIAAPALAETLFSAAISALGRILNTRAGVGLIVGIGCLILGELYGTHQANMVCQGTLLAAEKRADAAAVTRDDQQAAVRSTEDQDYITKLEALNKTNEEQIHGYVDEITARKVSVCTLSPADMQRLQ